MAVQLTEDRSYRCAVSSNNGVMPTGWSYDRPSAIGLHLITGDLQAGQFVTLMIDGTEAGRILVDDMLPRQS